MSKILIATKNKGKLDEYVALFHGTSYQVISLLDFEEDFDIKETGFSFEENAMIKAKAASDFFQCNAIADDSGLEVFALNNQPGIYSKRYSPSGKDDDNNDLLLSNLNGITNREARFVCIISFVKYQGKSHLFRGEIYGSILTQKKGINGFGYDPLFYVDQEQCTMAQLNPNLKNQISHRGIAFRKLLNYIVGEQK